MAGRAGKVAKGIKKVAEKVVHPPYLSTYIRAGRAMPAPPLGPQLGQVRDVSGGIPPFSGSISRDVSLF